MSRDLQISNKHVYLTPTHRNSTIWIHLLVFFDWLFRRNMLILFGEKTDLCQISVIKTCSISSFFVASPSMKTDKRDNWPRSQGSLFHAFSQVKNTKWILFEGFSTVLFLVFFFSTNDVNWRNWKTFKERSVPIITKAWNHLSLNSNPIFLFMVSSVVFCHYGKKGRKKVHQGGKKAEWKWGRERQREREIDIPGKREKV